MARETAEHMSDATTSNEGEMPPTRGKTTPTAALIVLRCGEAT